MTKRTAPFRGIAAVVAIGALVACSPAAGSTPVVPSSATVTSGASKVSTVAAGPTGQAAASTVTAGASTAATAAAGPAGAAAVGTATTAAPVRIVGAQLNPSGPTLTLQNTGGQPVDMTGWKLRVGTTAVALPANSRVGANETVTIHVASGTSTGKDVYLGAEAASLATALRPGARVAIENQAGSTVTEFALPA
jgi:hypothetical protein